MLLIGFTSDAIILAASLIGEADESFLKDVKIL